MSKKEFDTIKSTRITVIGGIIVAIIGLCGTLVLGYWQFVLKPKQTEQADKTAYVGRVIDANTQQAINGAKITLDLEGVPPVVYSDSEGVYRFEVAIKSDISGQVRVDAQGYQVYTRNITISPDINTMEDIRLEPLPLDQPANPTSTITASIESTVTPETSITVTSDEVVKSIPINKTKVSSNFDGQVILTLEKIETLANNRMRWHLSFFNQTDQDVSMEFGDSNRHSNVVDEFGTRYIILSQEPANFIATYAPAGTKITGWMEFDLPANGAKNFKLFLERWTFGSHQLKYDTPLEISLSEPLYP